MVLEPQQALTFQMSQLVLYQKSIILLITLPMHFGQFDNYTPMQLAQYVGTIANNGVRIAPHIVEGDLWKQRTRWLRELNPIYWNQGMNKINISESDVSILQQGFYQVSHGGSALTTGRAFSNGAAVSISGKTGTAESYVEGGQKS